MKDFTEAEMLKYVTQDKDFVAFERGRNSVEFYHAAGKHAEKMAHDEKHNNFSEALFAYAWKWQHM